MHGWMGDARETTGVDVAPVTPLARLGPARGMARMVSLPRFLFIYFTGLWYCLFSHVGVSVCVSNRRDGVGLANSTSLFIIIRPFLSYFLFILLCCPLCNHPIQFSVTCSG